MPAPVLRSSGDLLADRLYAYAQGAFEEGDFTAAADLARQMVERAPSFGPAHALLGRSLMPLGRAGDAQAALEEALRLEPEDTLGVRLDLARLGALPPEEAISDGYVRALFDDYAPRFDRHLVKSLAYRGHSLIADAVRRAASRRMRPFHFAQVLDLGCGTGLMAQALAGAFERMEGVDLSPQMLRKAAKTHLYAHLHEGELVAFLRSRGTGEADLVVAADVFVYMASLDAAFREAHRVLARAGLFAFTVQAHDGPGFLLGEDSRYAHGASYLRSLAEAAGFAPVLLESVSTRQDKGLDVPGLLAVLER